MPACFVSVILIPEAECIKSSCIAATCFCLVVRLGWQFNGVLKIYPGTVPPELGMKQGRALHYDSGNWAKLLNGKEQHYGIE